MRKIEQQMIDAIHQRKSWHNGNTSVIVCQNTARVYLHDNFIAQLNFASPGDPMPDTIWLSHAGWATRTTCSRLNALLTEFTRRVNTKRYYVRTRDRQMQLVAPNLWDADKWDVHKAMYGTFALTSRPTFGYMVAAH